MHRLRRREPVCLSWQVYLEARLRSRTWVADGAEAGLGWRWLSLTKVNLVVEVRLVFGAVVVGRVESRQSMIELGLVYVVMRKGVVDFELAVVAGEVVTEALVEQN